MTTPQRLNWTLDALIVLLTVVERARLVGLALAKSTLNDELNRSRGDPADLRRVIGRRRSRDLRGARNTTEIAGAGAAVA